MVAGGAGFLGSHLCKRLLDEGCSVVCVDNFQTGRTANLVELMTGTSFSVIRHDVIQPLKIDGSIDEVYNLACAASPPKYQQDPIHTMQTCVNGTLNLLELARAKGARFFQASTSEVYGDPMVHPQPEEYHGNVNPYGPRSCYDEGKRAAEALCHDFADRFDLTVKVARIFNTYGPQMLADDGRVVSNFIVQALKGDPITIYGSGDQTRSFCYVDDLIEGILRLMRSDDRVTTPVNLGNPVEFTMLQLAELVIGQTGSSSSLVSCALPVDDPRQRRPDISRAKEALDWEPTTMLADGLAKTTAYFADQITHENARLSELA